MESLLTLAGALYLRRREHALAVRCLERAAVLIAQAPWPDAAMLSGALSTLGSAHQAGGAHSQALLCYEKARDLLEKRLADVAASGGASTGAAVAGVSAESR